MQVCQEDQTVLFAAVDRGNERIVEYLLLHGAKKYINACDCSGRSLLNVACYGGNTALVQILLKYKIDVRKEKKLVRGNEEIANILNLELKTSTKNREKVEQLKFLDDEKLKKVLHLNCICMI